MPSIVFTGGHGTGKTTLAREISERLEIPFIEEGAREVLKKYCVAENLGSYPDKVIIRVQREIANRHLVQVYAKENFVADRGIQDILAYSLHWLSRSGCACAKEFLSELSFSVGTLLGQHKYSHIFLVPPYGEIESDGVRNTDMNFSREIDYLVRGILSKNMEDHRGVDFYVVKALELDCRVEEVLKMV